MDDGNLFSPEFSVARDGALVEAVTGARGDALAEEVVADGADVIGVNEGVACDVRVGASRLECLSCGACLCRYSLSGTSDVMRIFVNWALSSGSREGQSEKTAPTAPTRAPMLRTVLVTLFHQ